MPRFQLSPRDPLVRDVATALLSGHWNADAVVGRMVRVLGVRRPQTWMHPLAEGILASFGIDPPPPRHAVLAKFLSADAGFCRAMRRRRTHRARRSDIEQPMLTDVLALDRPVMLPAPALHGTEMIPALATPGELAAWLGLTPAELDWFADCLGRERRLSAGPLRHYRYLWIKKSGSGQRLLECPKPRLRTIQRRILDEILSPIPPHDAAHAFRSGRSTLSFAAPHAGQRVVLRIDLRDFFPSIRHSRVQALFHSLGYPERVARLLTGLCTNSVPDDIIATEAAPEQRLAILRTFGQPHLPQGAPTSPALANLSAWRLDCRLKGLARRNGAVYTRYADDLVFSGGRSFERSLSRFRIYVCAIALDEGFSIRQRKTRVMRCGVRQEVAGLVVNRDPGIARSEYDLLKAVLHNCERLGPASQNRDQVGNFRDHLRGRIAYVQMIQPSRGARLLESFERIGWSES